MYKIKRFYKLFLGICFMFFGLFNNTSSKETSNASSIYDFTVKDIKGKDVSLSEYKGKVIIIVNVASYCGYTKQYAGLEKLYKTYNNTGLVILGFPCNQFGEQEPGTEEEIVKFCSANYGVTFPMFSKIEVNGENADPLYKFLISQGKGEFGTQPIKWNFSKFVINRNGQVVDRLGSKSDPESMTLQIEKLLSE